PSGTRPPRPRPRSKRPAAASPPCGPRRPRKLERLLPPPRREGKIAQRSGWGSPGTAPHISTLAASQPVPPHNGEGGTDDEALDTSYVRSCITQGVLDGLGRRAARRQSRCRRLPEGHRTPQAPAVHAGRDDRLSPGDL